MVTWDMGSNGSAARILTIGRNRRSIEEARKFSKEIY
jgi:hypothetical protein